MIVYPDLKVHRLSEQTLDTAAISGATRMAVCVLSKFLAYICLFTLECTLINGHACTWALSAPF